MNTTAKIIPRIMRFILIFMIAVLSVSAAPDLVIELGKLEELPQSGFSKDYVLPYTIKNIGDEAVTSRLGVRTISPNSLLNTAAYPIYAFKEGNKIRVNKADGSSYLQEPVIKGIYKGKELISNAPTITLQPGESITFKEGNSEHFNVFHLYSSGSASLGYEIDPDNEIAESDENNNLATATIDVSLSQVIKGPNEGLKLSEKQYWVNFNDLKECVTLDLPAPTKVCLVDAGLFTAKLTIDGEEVTLYHFFDLWSIKKGWNNLELEVSDGFFIGYE
jgi:hypothetical protein